MNILSAIKKKYDDTMNQIGRQTRIRHQLNMKVDLRLKEYLKVLQAELGVPRDIIGEHVLETGLHQISRILGKEKLATALRRHLTNGHLLDGEMEDSETMLRLGEGDGSIAGLLVQIEPILYNWRGLQQALVIAKRTGNLAPFEAWKKQLMNSAVVFAEWLEKNYVDEPGSSEAEARLQEDEEEDVDEDADEDNNN